MKIVFRSATLVFVMTGLALLATGCFTGGDHPYDVNYASVDEIVSDSDRIVAARFVEAEQQTIEEDTTGDGSPDSQFMEVFSRFVITQSFKGSALAGDEMVVVTGHDPYSGRVRDSEGVVHEFVEGQEYVLFLYGRRRPLNYPPDYGNIVWSHTGEPGIATVENGQMHFLATQRYMDYMSTMGLQSASTDSVAPFELSLDGLREMTGQ
ncbi:MAG: hypothetical protein WD208_09380 [Dehalococcoidia bacterium]